MDVVVLNSSTWHGLQTAHALFVLMQNLPGGDCIELDTAGGPTSKISILRVYPYIVNGKSMFLPGGRGGPIKIKQKCLNNAER